MGREPSPGKAFRRARWGVAALLCAAVHAGCGYGFVRPDGGGPVAELTLGRVLDATAEGDLGLRLRGALARRLAGLARPRLVTAAGAPVLTGAVRLQAPRTLAYDAAGAAFRIRLLGDLSLGTPATGQAPAWEVWSSGDVEVESVYARGASAVETEANRRLAIEAAVERLADALVERLVTSPGIEP